MCSFKEQSKEKIILLRVIRVCYAAYIRYCINKNGTIRCLNIRHDRYVLQFRSTMTTGFPGSYIRQSTIKYRNDISNEWRLVLSCRGMFFYPVADNRFFGNASKRVERHCFFSATRGVYSRALLSLPSIRWAIDLFRTSRPVVSSSSVTPSATRAVVFRRYLRDLSAPISVALKLPPKKLFD